MRKLILQNKPLVAATIHLHEEIELIGDIAANGSADILELRADRFFDGNTSFLKRILQDIKASGLPVILTMRQGEVPNLSEKKRLEIISELMPEADAVDIELGASICQDVVRAARTNSKIVIISEHDFDKTPSEGELDIIFKKSIEKGADVVKIAVTPNSPVDAAKLMCFCLKSSKQHPVACISMGEVGAFTRVYGHLFGSSITYGFISEPIAPGQLDVRELKRKISKFF